MFKAITDTLGFTGPEDYSEEFKAKVFADIDATLKKIAPREQAKQYLPLTDEWHVREKAYTQWKNGGGETERLTVDPPFGKTNVIRIGDVAPVREWPVFEEFMAYEKEMEAREDAIIAGDDALVAVHDKIIQNRYNVTYRIERADELWRKRLSINLSDEDVAWIMDDPSIKAALVKNMTELNNETLMRDEVFRKRVAEKVRANALETIEGTMREAIKDRESGPIAEWMEPKVSEYAERSMDINLVQDVLTGHKITDQDMLWTIEEAIEKLRKDPSVAEHLAAPEPAYDMEGKPIGEIAQENKEEAVKAAAALNAEPAYDMEGKPIGEIAQENKEEVVKAAAAAASVPASDKEGRFEEFENASKRASAEDAAAVVQKEAAKQESSKFTPELWKIFVSDPSHGERGRKNAAEEKKRIDAMPEGDAKKKALEIHEKKVATMERHIAKAEAERKYAETLSKGQAEIAALEEQAKQKQAQYEQAKKDSAKAIADNKAMLDAKYEAQKKEADAKIAALQSSTPAQAAVVAQAATPAATTTAPTGIVKFTKQQQGQRLAAWNAANRPKTATGGIKPVKFTREQQGQRLTAWNANERAQALAKARAYWAQHPGSEIVDKQKTARMVRRAADYDPPRNDFAGVDTRAVGIREGVVKFR